MQDKKKFVVFGVLVLALLAVGAFQFLGGSSKPAFPDDDETPKALAKKEEPVDPEEAQREELKALMQGPLDKRDPFKTDRQPEQAKKPEAQTSGNSRPGPSIAPFEPLPGGLTGDGSPVDLAPSAPIRQPGEFAYAVRGVVVGAKPMAVFEDDFGNQRLVALGASIDPDSRVVRIERGRVTVRHRGKDRTLTLEEATTSEK